MVKRNGEVLVIDDEPAILQVMEANLRKEGYSVHTALNAYEGLDKLRQTRFDTVIVDYQLPQFDGLSLLEEMKRVGIQVPVIVITAYGTIEQAVRAMRLGAVDYLTKPINYDELTLVVKNAVTRQNLAKEIERLRRVIDEKYAFSNIVGKNPRMLQVFELIANIAETDATVLIRGETGTGKELIARAIHFNSLRKVKEFMKVNCAALTETLLESELFGHEKGAFTGAIKTRIGRFEQASGGTIFLDEIGDIAVSTQSKLLRVLQEMELERVGGNETIKVDVRIISATNKDLEELIKEGSFREDLYYRLNVIPIEVPALRDRPDDIPHLAYHFVKTYAERYNKKIESIVPEAVQMLMNYDWPGNIRELKNVIERAIIMERGEIITEATIAMYTKPTKDRSYQFFINEDLPFSTVKKSLVDRFEREYLSKLLAKHNGNISAAAKTADLDYKNFCEKMKKYHLSKWDFRRQ
jgi:DNA-binding NtrC family response regulator